MTDIPAAPVPLSPNCRRLLALRAQHTRLGISSLALDLAHQAHPTVANLRELAALNHAVQQSAAAVNRASGLLTEGESAALAAYLNPTDEAAEAKAVGGILVPAGAVVH